jgi:hypothetical protein
MTNGNDQRAEPPRARPPATRSAASMGQPANLADILERVLDKGIVIAGDVTLSLGTIELLTLRIRLLIASVDKAQQIGIDWWKSDPSLSSQARKEQLEQRIERLESIVGGDSHTAVKDNTGLEDRLKRLEATLGEKGQEGDGDGS